jgi:hypothetical protein
VLVPADRQSEHAPPRACPVVVFEEIHVESALALIAASWAIAMALGPVLQIRKIVEHRSSRSISIEYFLVLLVGFTGRHRFDPGGARTRTPSGSLPSGRT